MKYFPDRIFYSKVRKIISRTRGQIFKIFHTLFILLVRILPAKFQPNWVRNVETPAVSNFTNFPQTWGETRASWWAEIRVHNRPFSTARSTREKVDTHQYQNEKIVRRWSDWNWWMSLLRGIVYGYIVLSFQTTKMMYYLVTNPWKVVVGPGHRRPLGETRDYESIGDGVRQNGDRSGIFFNEIEIFKGVKWQVEDAHICILIEVCLIVSLIYCCLPMNLKA